MAVELKRASEITRESIETFLANQDEIRDVLPGTPEHDLIEAVFARATEGLYRAIVALQDEFYIRTATGASLDRRGLDFGLVRKDALPARGEVTFTGAAGSSIPLGTLVRRPPVSGSDAVTYSTDIAAKIPTGQTTVKVPVTADEDGIVGNAAPFTITEFPGGAPSGITAVTNEQSLDSGRERESDAEFRQVILEFFESLTRGTVPSINFAARRVEGVFRAFFAENKPAAGQGILYLDTGSSTATDAIRDAVKAVVEGDGSDENRGYLPAGTKIRVEALTGAAFDAAVAPVVADPSLQRFNIAVYLQEAA